MKKIILALGIILLGIGCNNEQKKLDKMTNKMMDKMTTVCQLTPDQGGKIKPLAENFIKTRKENKDKYSTNQEALKTANQANRKKFVDTLKAILSPDQFEKLKAYYEQQKANKQEGQGGENGNGGQE